MSWTQNQGNNQNPRTDNHFLKWHSTERARRTWITRFCFTKSDTGGFYRSLHLRKRRPSFAGYYKQSKVKTQNRYFILYLNSCKKGPDKSHSSFAGIYFHTCGTNGFTVFSHQFIFHTAFHTALKKRHNSAHHGKSLPGFVAFYGFLYFMSAGNFLLLFFSFTALSSF